MEIRKIIKVGNSIAVCLPFTFSRRLDLAPGSYVECKLDAQGNIVISPHTNIKDSSWKTDK